MLNANNMPDAEIYYNNWDFVLNFSSEYHNGAFYKILKSRAIKFIMFFTPRPNWRSSL